MLIDLGENRDNQTWSGLLVFIVGLQEDKMADLEEESDQNGDLVITEHMDSYNNLTLKTMAAFDWMLTFCPQTEYLLKTDDDMFIQVRFCIPIHTYFENPLSLSIVTRAGLL